MRSPLKLGPVLSVVAFAIACGGSKPASAPTPVPSGGGAADLSAPRAPGALRRSEVQRTIDKGLGYFLQDVTVDEWPVLRHGKFHGFRIKEIHADWGVDLKPGDVVLRVNGMPIERPEQADAALRSLRKASALRIDYEREGAHRILELPILDDAPDGAPPR
jgi:S1-C subfamily serine protease